MNLSTFLLPTQKCPILWPSQNSRRVSLRAIHWGEGKMVWHAILRSLGIATLAAFLVTARPIVAQSLSQCAPVTDAARLSLNQIVPAVADAAGKVPLRLNFSELKAVSQVEIEVVTVSELAQPVTSELPRDEEVMATAEDAVADEVLGVMLNLTVCDRLGQPVYPPKASLADALGLGGEFLVSQTDQHFRFTPPTLGTHVGELSGLSPGAHVELAIRARPLTSGASVEINPIQVTLGENRLIRRIVFSDELLAAPTKTGKTRAEVPASAAKIKGENPTNANKARIGASANTDIVKTGVPGVYRFNGSAGQELDAFLRSDNDEGDPYLTLLRLVDGAWEFVDSNDDSGVSLNSHLTSVLPAEGSYALAASTRFGEGVLRLSAALRAPRSFDPKPLTPGDARSFDASETVIFRIAGASDTSRTIEIHSPVPVTVQFGLANPLASATPNPRFISIENLNSNDQMTYKQTFKTSDEILVRIAPEEMTDSQSTPQQVTVKLN
jgi:hypothetical protein